MCLYIIAQKELTSFPANAAALLRWKCIGTLDGHKAPLAPQKWIIDSWWSDVAPISGVTFGYRPRYGFHCSQFSFWFDDWKSQLIDLNQTSKSVIFLRLRHIVIASTRFSTIAWHPDLYFADKTPFASWCFTFRESYQQSNTDFESPQSPSIVLNALVTANSRSNAK